MFDERFTQLVSEAVEKATTDAMAKMSAAPEVLSSQEAAELLKVHEKVLLKWTREKGVPCFRIGRLYRFRRSEILAWLDRHRES